MAKTKNPSDGLGLSDKQKRFGRQTSGSNDTTPVSQNRPLCLSIAKSERQRFEGMSPAAKERYLDLYGDYWLEMR